MIYFFGITTSIKTLIYIHIHIACYRVVLEFQIFNIVLKFWIINFSVLTRTSNFKFKHESFDILNAPFFSLLFDLGSDLYSTNFFYRFSKRLRLTLIFTQIGLF